MNMLIIAGAVFIVFAVFLVVTIARLDKKLKEDHLNLTPLLKTDKPYLAIITLKEVNDGFQIMVDGRLLSSYLMDRGDVLPEGYSAPVRLNLSRQLQVMRNIDKFDAWIPCLAPANELTEDTVYAYAENKDDHIEWNRFAYDEGNGPNINTAPLLFDKGNYKLFIQQFHRIAEAALNKY
jgi:hypothetical protein